MATNKRAISPIIATILILMMVVASAGGMFYWITRIQGQQQGGVESYQGKLQTTMASSVDILKASYNDSAQNLTIYAQNIGNNPIPTTAGTTYPTTEWIVFDSNQKSICSSNWGGSTNPTCASGCGTDISIGQIRQIILSLSGTGCSITSQPNSSRISFTIDFSGKTAASGSFNK